jgi:hypothetical protein
VFEFMQARDRMLGYGSECLLWSSGMWHRVAWYIPEIGFDVLAVFGVMPRMYQNALPRPHKIKSDLTVAFRNYTRVFDKSLARPGRKQGTATEDFDVHISYL